jgi:hypothetical protein
MLSVRCRALGAARSREGREERRVLKLVARMMRFRFARDNSRRNMRGEVGRGEWQCESGAVRVRYRNLIKRARACGGRTLRMSAEGYTERKAEHGVVLSNWEI